MLTITNTTVAYANQSTIQTVTDHLYLLEQVEIVGSLSYESVISLSHTRQLDYYNQLGVTNRNCTVIGKTWWWTRKTLNADNPSHFMVILALSSSCAQYEGAAQQFSVYPVFRIG